ncbi:MAG TPA: hypothetical protein VGS80_17325 [Ktedonobacterales bacterium]|nr:hypothetical protein [Ktedonobacterales bacterium]
MPHLKAACPDYAEVNAQVLQDVLLRLDRALQAFLRRGAAGEEPGYPRFPGRGRSTSFTYPQVGGMAARGSTRASWSCPRSAGLPCAGLARWRARPRP